MMFIDIVLITLALIITYTFLVYLIIKEESFQKMILLSSSIILFFIIIFNSLINISGYPSSSSLPNKFHLLNVNITNDNIFILIKDTESNSYPRLHVLDYSESLEDDLKQASSDLKDGKMTIGEIDQELSNNHYGITFKYIKKNIPIK